MVVGSKINSVMVLAGGVGAARFLRGLALVHDQRATTALVNTGDDTVLHGLNISPDIDTVIYTLSEAIDPQRGWGLSNETWRAMESLKRYVDVRPTGSIAAPEWFNLGDQDLATHFYRTARKSEGADASQITSEIARAWKVAQRIVPMTNNVVATFVELAQDCQAGKAGEQISFQEYFVKYQHSVAVRAIYFQGAETAKPNCIDELSRAEVIVIAPSNPDCFNRADSRAGWRRRGARRKPRESGCNLANHWRSCPQRTSRSNAHRIRARIFCSRHSATV